MHVKHLDSHSFRFQMMQLIFTAVEFNVGKFLFSSSILTDSCYIVLPWLCTETNQIEDPRLKWREEQERMLKEYLADASQDLAVSVLDMLLVLLNLN